MKEGKVAGRFCSVAGLVKLIDEKGKLVFLADWGFILLAVLIHLSRFQSGDGRGCHLTARVLRRRLGRRTSCQMRLRVGKAHMLQCHENTYTHI